jgi:hypothetical protein
VGFFCIIPLSQPSCPAARSAKYRFGLGKISALYQGSLAAGVVYTSYGTQYASDERVGNQIGKAFGPLAIQRDQRNGSEVRDGESSPPV